MPRGCCSSGASDCRCRVVGKAGSLTTVDGSGSPDDPFIVDVDVRLEGSHSSTFDTTVSGDGSVGNPWVVGTRFASGFGLDNIGDVNAPAPSNGQVLAWDAATGKWVAAAPTTAAAGSVQTDTSLNGDGSVGSPLGVAPDTARLLATFSTGLGLSDNGMASVVQHFADAADRTNRDPNPRMNSLSMLDTNPGEVYYWTGTAWALLPNRESAVANREFLALSGAYAAGKPVTTLVRQVSVTTDQLGNFNLLSAADLTGYSGVLSVMVQETGSPAWKAVPVAAAAHVTGIAYRLTDGSVMNQQPITAIVQALLY